MDNGVQYAISTGTTLIFAGLIWVAYQLAQIANVLRDIRLDGLNSRISDLTLKEARLQEALAEMEEEECS